MRSSRTALKTDDDEPVVPSRGVQQRKRKGVRAVNPFEIEGNILPNFFTTYSFVISKFINDLKTSSIVVI